MLGDERPEDEIVGKLIAADDAENFRRLFLTCIAGECWISRWGVSSKRSVSAE